MLGCSLGAQGGDQGHVCAAGGPTLMRTGPSASGPASDLPAQLWCNPLNCHRAPLRDAGTSTPRHGHFRNFPPSQTKIPTHHLVLGPPPPRSPHPASGELGPRTAVNPRSRWKLGDAPRTPSRKQPPSAPPHPQPPGHLGPQVPRQLQGHHGDRRRHHQRVLPQRATAQHPTPRTKGLTPRAGGRRLRPGPCFWAAQGRGGSASAAMPACLGEPVGLPVL